MFVVQGCVRTGDSEVAVAQPLLAAPPDHHGGKLGAALPREALPHCPCHLARRGQRPTFMNCLIEHVSNAAGFVP